MSKHSHSEVGLGGNQKARRGGGALAMGGVSAGFGRGGWPLAVQGGVGRLQNLHTLWYF